MLNRRLLKLYRASWVGLYFDYWIQNIPNNEAVAFYHNDGRTLVSTDRFRITVYISDQTKAYFLPETEWERITIDVDGGIDPAALSTVKHAFLTKGFPYTKSPFYTAPYFIHFNSSARAENNYLMYNEFFQPNTSTTILGLFNYDDIVDRFVPGFLTPIKLQNQNFLSLNTLLEFKIVDSNQREVEFADLSQLFVSISIT